MEKKISLIIRIITTFFFIIGVLASLFIFHEIYHLHNGIPAGVCIGNCQIQGVNGLVPMVMFFKSNLNLNVLNEENNAWAFSIIINFIIIFVYWILRMLRREKK